MKRILLVEDESADVEFIRHVFRQHESKFDLRVASSLLDARSEMSRAPPDLLMSDLVLPDGQGIDLIRDACEHNCPAIVLTGKGSEETAVQALHKGALDYMVKSEDVLRGLPRAVCRAIREWNNMVERERSNRLLAQSEERFRSFAELAVDWYWETDADMRIRHISDGFFRITRLAADLTGRPLRQLHHPCDEGVDWDDAEELWRERREFELEVPFDGSGQARLLYLRGKPYFDEHGAFNGYRGIGRDITQEREAIKEITFLAMHDPLTETLNRRSLEAELKTALLRVARHGETHSFCFFDLDEFKRINDEAGHVVGDRILKEVASTISASVRSGDIVGRLGGDEFGVLLKNCTLSKAVEIANNILAAVGSRRFDNADAATRVTASGGAVALRADGDVVGIYREADQACYRSKHEGGNRLTSA